MKHINHITLNTGHMRQTLPGEVDKELYFVLKRILKDSLSPEGGKLMDGYTLKSTQTSTATIATIFGANGAPVLTTLCSSAANVELWDMLYNTATTPIDTKRLAPSAPYIADRIDIGAMSNLDAMSWTGDFSRCFGWLCLSPSSIR
ncbi:hypothetical protein D3C75_395820 [compost metagenome]